MTLSAQSPRLKSAVRALALSGLASLMLIGTTADAKTFRWASQGDVLTMDQIGRASCRERV